jgi:hypothetical protein
VSTWTLGGAVVSLAVLALVLGLAVPAAAAVPPASGAGVPAGLLSHAPATAPVFVHFKPKSISAAQNTTITLSAVVKDNGTRSYTATACKLWYRHGTSGAWTLSSSCLSSSYFPHTFSAHSKTKFSGHQHVSATFPTGTYQWKLELLGTYHGVSEPSHSGILTVAIT